MPKPMVYSAEMVRALPEDGKRYETVHGELLVTPAPRLAHQEMVGRLYYRLTDYCAGAGIGHALFSPADISFSEDVLVQPDVFVAARDEVATMEWARVRTLLLVVEVLSPSSLRADRFTKRRLYQEVGVPVYWAVDAENRSVEVWTPSSPFPVTELAVLRWQPPGAGAALEIRLEELFRSFKGDAE